MPVYPLLGLSKNDQAIFQVPTRMYIRSILIRTMPAHSEYAGIAQFEMNSGTDTTSHKELCQFQKGYSHQNIRTIQAMANMIIEAGTLLFFTWYLIQLIRQNIDRL